MSNITEAFSNNSYIILRDFIENNSVNSTSFSWERVFPQLNALSVSIQNFCKEHSIRTLPLDARDAVAAATDLLWKATQDCIKMYTDKIPDAHAYYVRALHCKLGGKVNQDLLMSDSNKDFWEFIHKNHLHHKVSVLGYQIGQDLEINIDSCSEPVKWRDITQEQRIDPITGKNHIHFFHQGLLVFCTTEDYKLTEDYCYIDGKIAAYNPASVAIMPFDHEEFPDGKFKLEIHTALKDKSGQRPKIGLGDHAYMVLVDAEGKRYGFGQIFDKNSLSCSDFIAPLSTKTGAIHTPDPYLLLPKGNYNIEKSTLELTEQQYNKLLTKLSSLKQDPNFYVTLLRKNCTSLCREFLMDLGVEAETGFNIVTLAIYALMPLKFVQAFDRFMKKIPSLVRKALYFFPLIYVPNALAGFTSILLSLKMSALHKMDIKPWDIIFRPWKVTFDHPFALRLIQNDIASKWHERNS